MQPEEMDVEAVTALATAQKCCDTGTPSPAPPPQWTFITLCNVRGLNGDGSLGSMASLTFQWWK